MEKKFKLQDDLAISVIHAPSTFTIMSNSNSKPYDRIISFVYALEEMVDSLQSIIKNDALAPGGYLFFVYPKKGNKQYDTFIARDDIFPALQVDENKFALQSPIKFTSLQSLDETFSIIGMKYEVKKTKKTAKSQCVDDYIAYIPQIEQFLSDDPETLVLYTQLTPGYKKDWARHVYSAKKEETQAARRTEMVEILKAGFKTKNLFMQSKK